MKKLSRVILLIWSGVVLLRFTGYAQKPSDNPRFVAKLDLLGIPTLASTDFKRFSPELEYRSTAWRSISLITDFEYFRGKKAVANFELAQLFNTPEYLFGTETQLELSGRLGLRKYFRVKENALSGFFAEIQTGLSNKSLDSSYAVVSHPPYRSENLNIEGRLRAGFQDSLNKKAWYSILLEVDPIRMIQRERWYRLVWVELNIGFGK